jgi:hypothetical protein
LQTEHPANADIRAKLLADYEARLKLLFPDKSDTVRG